MSDVFVPYSGQGPLGAVSIEAAGFTPKQLARAQFLTWLKRTHPVIFNHGLRVAERAKASFVRQSGNPAALSGLGLSATESGAVVTEPKSWWQSLAEGITQAGTAYLAYRGQRAAIDANMRRVDQGLPPMDYSPYMAPTVRTQVDVSPEIMARLRETGADTMKTVSVIAIGAAGVFLLSKMIGGKRR
jgi:hypothetical protein